MAATDSTLDVQKALVAAIKGNGAVAALIGTRVYDEVPQDAVFPYVSIADMLGEPAVETISGEGFEVLASVHIWSRARGAVEARQIAAAIVNVLNNAALTLDTKTCVMTRLAGQLNREFDARTTQIIQRWQVVTDG